MPRPTHKSRPRAKSHRSQHEKQKLLSGFRTSAILEASRRVFAKKGFDAALVDDIAAEAGIAKGTVYLYFKSKTDIYHAALQEDMAALARLKTERVAAASTPRDKLRAYIAAAVEYCERRRDFFRIFLVESGKLACPALHSPKQQRELAAGQVAILLDLFKHAAAAREIHCPDPDFTAWTVGYTIRALIERRLLTPSVNTPAHDIDTLLHFLWNGLAPIPKSKPLALKTDSHTGLPRRDPSNARPHPFHPLHTKISSAAIDTRRHSG
jgi:AcrR family transcriptional regulator